MCTNALIDAAAEIGRRTFVREELGAEVALLLEVHVGLERGEEAEHATARLGERRALGQSRFGGRDPRALRVVLAAHARDALGTPSVDRLEDGQEVLVLHREM